MNIDMLINNNIKKSPIMFITECCENDIQLELNRNYLKSFPARLKFYHIVSEFCSISWWIRIKKFLCFSIAVFGNSLSIFIDLFQRV